MDGSTVPAPQCVSLSCAPSILGAVIRTTQPPDPESVLVSSASRPIRLLIAGGGTGGHVLPAVAVIEEFRRRDIAFEGLWVGSHGGVEREIAAASDVPFVAIQTGKLRRYVAVQTITDGLRVPVGIVQAWQKVRAFKPDVIYSTGGAVSVPSVVAGARRAPVLTHEQTAQIGIANKTAARFARTFAVGFEETAELARQRHANVVVTGNPVRSSLATGDADRGRAQAGFTGDLPVLYVTGGARGASPLNQRVEQIVTDLLSEVQIVHQVGPASANSDYQRLTELRAQLPATLANRYLVVEFVREELPDVYAMTDLVLARSGLARSANWGILGSPPSSYPCRAPGATSSGRMRASLGTSAAPW